MNKQEGMRVVIAIFVTFLFLPELMFLFLSVINYYLWDKVFRRHFSYRTFWLKQKSRYWFWKEIESIDLTYLDTLREYNMPIKTKTQIATHVYVPSSEKDLPAEEQTQFTFKDLLHSEAVVVSDQLFGLSAETGAVDSLRAQTLTYKMMLKRLVGWKNLLDEHGNQIPFPSKDPAAVAQIVDELANAAPEIVAEMQRAFGSTDGKGRND